MEHPHTPLPTETHGVGHEERDVSLRPVLFGLIGLFALVILSAFLMWAVFTFFAVREAAESPPRNPLAQQFGRELPPQPRLQPDPLQDLASLQAHEDAILHSYGWVDRKAGVVRIPVERAVELLAQRGLPVRPAPPAGGAQ